MYVGNHGTYSSLGTVLQAAKMLETDPAIRIVLVGGGDQKPMLQDMARDLGLTNTTFVDSVPKRAVPSYLERADLGLIPYQDMPLFAGALPNKTFDYMAAGRPLLAAAPVGELTGLVDRARCGWNVAPEDPTAMAAAIRDIAAQRDDARGRGAAGREYALAEYDRQVLAARFVRLVDDLAASPRTGRRRRAS
jgi:glycosyltransferase involved in cell wall biosynthesis